MTAAPAVLVLEDGLRSVGEAYGAVGTTFGEAVFSTGMTGYQETLTDPSYHRQVVVMTAPHVGNTGVNDEDGESTRFWVSGYVVRDPARMPSSWRSRRSLEDELRAQSVVGISGVDTRALTRHLRERGAMRVGIFSGADAALAPDAQLAAVLGAPGMVGADLTGAVTTPEPYVVPPRGRTRFRVAAIDLGIKSATPRHLAALGIETTVLPSTVTPGELLAASPDGVFLSNGPGDPATADTAVELARTALDQGIPLFGICFGHQIVGRALGLETYKLRYGHRGINLPVLDCLTGRVEVTAHNHGFAVQAPEGSGLQASPERAYEPVPFGTPYGAAEVSHVCLNDDVAEGLRCRDVPAFSVQYHPEAAAGPHDAGYLFQRFVDLMTGRDARA
jgi:carbamoyl-phosphate synthase small subunit